MTTDRIEKNIVLRAPQARVWRALTDAKEFGEWFHMEIADAFAPGVRVHGRITEPGYEHLSVEMAIEQIVPEHLFSFRWHPYAIDPSVDYSGEPMTLIEFRLVEVVEGTRLTVVESGFDRIPAGRRAEAFRMDSDGWAAQLANIERYVAA